MGAMSEGIVNTPIAFCESCRKNQPVRLVEETEALEIDGTTYQYAVRHGYCSVCGGLATPQDVLDGNQRSFDAAVRSANHIVAQDVVGGMVQRYDIKPRPLSALLGWGEHTYSRFVEGDIPSRSFSDRIASLWESPLSFLMLLLENGSVLTGVALKKSKAAASKALVQYGTKAERVCAYLIGRTESNSSLALQKELYYAQGLMLAFFDTPLIPNRCEAWTMGPVFPEVWETIHPREVSEESLVDCGLADCVQDTFTEDELAVLEAVATRVGRYSPFALRDLTHRESPWVSARGTLPDDAPSSSPIDNSAIRGFFVEVRSQYGMAQPADIGRYMEDRVGKA